MEESIVFGPEIDDRQLDREVDSVNDALAETGTISPDVDTSGLGGMGGGGVGMNSGIPGQIASLVPMADYRNRLLEDLLDSGQAVGGGGGGGGGMGLLETLGFGLGGLSSIGIPAVLGFTANEVSKWFRDAIGVDKGGFAGLKQIFTNIPSRMRRVVDNIKSAFPDFSLQVPGFIRDGLSLQIPEFLRGGLSIQVPGWLRDVTQTLQDINPFDPSTRNGGGEGGGPLSGLFDGPLYQGPDPFNLGPAGTPGQRAGASYRDQRFRNDPAANPSQINRRPLDVTANINLDPSGLDDLQRQLKRDLQNDLVPQITRQVERNLSIGLGGGN